MWKDEDAVDMIPAVLSMIVLVEFQLVAGVYGKANDEPLERQVPSMAKQPSVRLKPTFEVEVAEPETVRPESVVVPKPSPATAKNFNALDDDATSKSGLLWVVVA